MQQFGKQLEQLERLAFLFIVFGGTFAAFCRYFGFEKKVRHSNMTTIPIDAIDEGLISILCSRSTL